MARTVGTEMCGSGGVSVRMSCTSLSNQSLILPQYLSDMLPATPATRDSFRHYISEVTPTPPPVCTIVPGSDGGLMACTLYTAINLFIGHLPASWRYIIGCACVHVCMCV